MNKTHRARVGVESAVEVDLSQLQGCAPEGLPALIAVRAAREFLKLVRHGERYRIAMQVRHEMDGVMREFDVELEEDGSQCSVWEVD